MTPSPLPLLVHQGPGEVILPILLYHHVLESSLVNPYTLAPAQFEAQMRLLWERGYRTISVAQFLTALESGTDLPICPVLITFDDGDEDVYTQALPILQRYGFTATVYLVVDYLDKPGFLRLDQVQSLLEAGWEVGSHSLSHPDLTRVGVGRVWEEVAGSRARLEALLGVPITTFAYPYGSAYPQILKKVRAAGYQAGMGLGLSYRHSPGSRFYLSRRPIEARTTLAEFANLLPWQTCGEKTRTTISGSMPSCPSIRGIGYPLIGNSSMVRERCFQGPGVAKKG